MSFASEVRNKMTSLVIGGFILGVIVSIVAAYIFIDSLFDFVWIGGMIVGTIFIVGFYLLEHRIGKITEIIDEELSKK